MAIEMARGAEEPRRLINRSGLRLFALLLVSFLTEYNEMETDSQRIGYPQTLAS